MEADLLKRLVEPHSRKEPRLSGLLGAGKEADLRLLLRAKIILSLGFPAIKIYINIDKILIG